MLQGQAAFLYPKKCDISIVNIPTGLVIGIMDYDFFAVNCTTCTLLTIPKDFITVPFNCTIFFIIN